MIVFVYVPGFYAAVEQADNPELRGRPLIVGGDPRKRGTVTSASVEACKAGVEPGSLVADALAICPDAELRPTRNKRYREVAAEVRSILRAEHERIEELGPEGTFLEPAEGLDPVAIAAEICVRLHSDLALGAVAGIGPGRFVAHLAARNVDDSGLRFVPEEEVLEFLGGFPVTEIWGLGPATAEKLAELGVNRIADLQVMKPEQLAGVVSRNAEEFLRLARGEDDAPLRAMPRAKTLSQERTLDSPTVDLRSLGESILGLAAQLENMLARERRAAGAIALGLTHADGTQVTRTQSLDTPVSSKEDIGEIGVALLGRTQAGVRQTRRLKLQVAKLSNAAEASESRQLRLF